MNEEIEQRFRDSDRQRNLTKESEAIIPSSLSNIDDRAQEQIETAQGSASVKSTAHPEPVPSKITIINIFQHPDAHPYVLDLLLLRKYDPEWVEWEPETLRRHSMHDFPTTSGRHRAIA